MGLTKYSVSIHSCHQRFPTSGLRSTVYVAAPRPTAIALGASHAPRMMGDDSEQILLRLDTIRGARQIIALPYLPAVSDVPIMPGTSGMISNGSHSTVLHLSLSVPFCVSLTVSPTFLVLYPLLSYILNIPQSVYPAFPLVYPLPYPLLSFLRSPMHDAYLAFWPHHSAVHR